MNANTLVAVKTSSEAVDDMKLSQVLEHNMTLRELVELIFPVTGRNIPRIQSVLRAGSMVRRMIRYRWAPLTVSPGELEVLLKDFDKQAVA